MFSALGHAIYVEFLRVTHFVHIAYCYNHLEEHPKDCLWMHARIQYRDTLSLLRLLQIFYTSAALKKILTKILTIIKINHDCHNVKFLNDIQIYSENSRLKYIYCIKNT